MRGISRAVSCLVALALFGALALPAQADPPVFTGLMNFPVIHGVADPEDYSWRVILSSEQELVQVDDQSAAVLFKGDGETVMTISAEEAHDATGAAVPTSLAVEDPDVVTLTVHHRAGIPAAGGAPFQYPVAPGPSFEVGPSTVIVTGPPDEAQLREERERAARERAAREQAEAAQTAGTAETQSCVVPVLRATSLRAAKRLLRGTGCGIGAVTKRPGAKARSGRVVAQRPRAGTVLPPESEINVTLDKAPHYVTV